MKKYASYYITGVSGTGKTSIANLLNKKGFRAISIDETEGLCAWRHKTTGLKVDYEATLNKEFIDTHDWVCDIDILKEMMRASKNTAVYVLGCPSNQNDILHLFDKIFLLQCAPEVFLKRIMERQDNDFGKDESAQRFILGWYQGFESELLTKGAIPIDASAALEHVAGEIIKQTTNEKFL